MYGSLPGMNSMPYSLFALSSNEFASSPAPEFFNDQYSLPIKSSLNLLSFSLSSILSDTL